MSRVLAVVVFATTLVSANAGLVDFNSSDGGFLSSTALGAGTPWTYSASSAVCAGGSGGCWTIPDYGLASDQRLTSPLFVAAGATSLSFDHTFNLEASSPFFFDGGVVEIAINGGAFLDVNTLYGPFSGQTYTGTIMSGFGNPIEGSLAFSGVNGAGFGTYASSALTLGLASGDTFQLRWRMGTDDSSTAGAPDGWLLDNVNVDASLVNAAEAPEPGTSGMALLGLAGLAYWFRRKKVTA